MEEIFMYNYNNSNYYGNSCNNMHSNKDMKCPCNNLSVNRSVFPENYMFGQSYVPWQEIKNTFEPSKGLSCGTIFPELYSPYRPSQSMELIKYLGLSSKGGCSK